MRHQLFLCLALAASLPAVAAVKPKAKAKAPVTKGKQHTPEIRFPVVDGCPKNKKEWQVEGPKILLEKAQRQHLPIEIPDFSSKLGKKSSGATASAVPFRGLKAPMVMVQAHDEESALYLSGVLKCDTEKHAPVLVSLTYVKGTQSGLAKIIEE